MFDTAWDDGLDDAQLAAVTHGSAPLVVLAGAGTGKTRTLTSRVARLLETGVRPERVLLLTFTRRAAEDMLARAGALCRDPDAGRRVWGGTFHAVAHRLVTEHAAALGLEHVTVLDPGDAADLFDLLRDEHGLTGSPGGERMPRPATLADIYSRAVNTGRPARDVVTADFPWCEPHADAVAAVLRDYVARKRAAGLLDFDDLLLAWRALLGQPELAQRLAERWDHVLVDEYQDVNAVQVDIVAGLRPDGRGLTVVGDDAQAVYGFRGARSGHLLDVDRRWPEARTVRLERNFRSRQPLLDLANAVRPGPPESRLQLRADRTDGTGRPVRPEVVRCYDAAEEARLVADAAVAAVEAGGRLREQAVLMRSGHHSDLLEVELTARRIPFVKYGGLKFLEAAHVKDFLAALRVTAHAGDELAWFRLLRLHEGIGPARARTLLPLLLDPEVDHGEVVAAAPAPARTRLDATLAGLAQARAAGDVPGTVRRCTEVVRPLVRERYADAAARLGDVDRLSEAAALAPDLPGFVAQLTLDPPLSTGDYAKPPHLDEDYLTLSTVHSAKGLEWPTVHVLHAVDGAFPSDMALSTPEGLEEEQRLFYVAITRARDRLSIYTPLRMPHHRTGRDDRHSLAPACRFLDDAALATVDVRQVGRPGARARRPAAVTVPRVEMPSLDALFG
ncbi:ATP-dependent helicase [Nakamurella endophytica]|uniref:DNA 3'-5' helicase n=1 Tax=Nakamurella endophytica TaxID=1748367 RepID=A0A917TCB8_9ACTN|nr:ATP-dependent helicase [Nakamurella endophytica]GGM17129.1 DNA helicase [Nakamurella endophytica]